jgi:hypothetical protein
MQKPTFYRGGAKGTEIYAEENTMNFLRVFLGVLRLSAVKRS